MREIDIKVEIKKNSDGADRVFFIINGIKYHRCAHCYNEFTTEDTMTLIGHSSYHKDCWDNPLPSIEQPKEGKATPRFNFETQKWGVWISKDDGTGYYKDETSITKSSQYNPENRNQDIL